ncbi:MAG: DUF2202 domain-containing protein [Actinomycetia bacterium]|nr:DUF2202 domain-containing protein [Actinomycetes bacterium]
MSQETNGADIGETTITREVNPRVGRPGALAVGAIAAALVISTAGCASGAESAQLGTTEVDTSASASTAQTVGQGMGRGLGRGSGQGAGQGSPLGSEPAGTLTPEMESQLIFLASEEQLAHDLYVLAYNTYGIQTFSNISRSETRHFQVANQVLALYGLPSQTQMGTPGEFADAQLQATYDALAERVLTSAEEAAAVGVLVEQTDIADLQAAVAMAPPTDVAAVLSNLLRASKQHLAAFQKLEQPEESIEVEATTNKNQSKIKIDVDPNSPATNYKVKVQKRVDGKWKTKKIRRTKGVKDTRTINVGAGTYRVKVPAQDGFEKAVSDAVQLSR